MATLHTARQNTAFTAKSRLKQIVRERPEQPPRTISTEPPTVEHIVETVHTRPAMSDTPPAAGTGHYRDRLTDLQQRQLLLNAVAIYAGWQLISVQNRPESDMLVAYLVRAHDSSDPTDAIRNGRAMQILMDAVGDMKVQHPRRQPRTVWQRWFLRLATTLAG